MIQFTGSYVNLVQNGDQSKLYKTGQLSQTAIFAIDVVDAYFKCYGIIFYIMAAIPMVVSQERDFYFKYSKL